MNVQPCHYIGIMAAALVFTGCNTEPPKCSDEKVTSVVLKLLAESLASIDKLDAAAVRAKLSLEFPMATALDEKIKKYSCDANLVVSGGYKINIGYTSQVGDDNRNVVSLKEMSGIQILPLRMALAAVLSEKATATTSQAATPTTEAPQPVAAAPAPAVATQVSFVPSFDCAKASTPSERAICSEPLLGKLDGALAENYKYMLASDIGDGAKGDLRAKQRAWIAERNKCSDNQCLETAYRARLEAVCEYPVLSGVHPICTTSAEIK